MIWGIISLLVLLDGDSMATDVKIAIASNFSSPNISSVNPYLNNFRSGLALALSDYRPDLDRLGYRLVLVEYDLGTTNLRVVEAASKILNDDVVAVIGFNSSREALLAAPILQKGEIPYISPTATATRLHSMGRFIHPVSVDNAALAKAIAGLVERRGLRRVASITDSECAYCVDLTEALSSALGSIGVGVDRYKTLGNMKSLPQLVDQLKKNRYQAIFIPNYELQSARIIRALIESGVNTLFLGGDSWENADGNAFFSLLSGHSFEGVFASDWHASGTALTRKFAKRFRTFSGKAANDDAVLAYDSMTYLIRGLISSKRPTRSKLEESLSNIQSFAGACGLYRINAQSKIERPLALLRVDTRMKKFDLLEWIE